MMRRVKRIVHARAPRPSSRPSAFRKPRARLADGGAVAHALRARARRRWCRIKREGDGGTPAGRFQLLWGYYRPDRWRPRSAGVPLIPMRRDQGWCEDPKSPRYNRPVRLPAADCTDRMWRDDHLYDLTFVLDQNFTRRAKGQGERDLLPHRPSRLDADRRLRCDFAIRHAKTRSAPGSRRGDGDRVGGFARSNAD